jgi:hypothetical protein
VRFPFAFEPLYRAVALPFGITPGRAWVEVGDDRFEAHFGFWAVATPLSNVAGTERSGPYATLKTLGPAHLSVADRGVTFASNGRQGLCLRFREPVVCIDPTGHLRHPGLTVTVADVDGLAAALEEAGRRS